MAATAVLCVLGSTPHNTQFPARSHSMAHDHRKVVLGLIAPATGVRTGVYKTVKGKKLEVSVFERPSRLV